MLNWAFVYAFHLLDCLMLDGGYMWQTHGTTEPSDMETPAQGVPFAGWVLFGVYGSL